MPTPPSYPHVFRQLDNGLRIVVSEDHLAPVVAVNLWYDVGSRHEQPGRTGLAHLFEHLMFQGSEHVARGEHFATINSAGGTLNGTTWCDRTNYYETLPANHLSTGLWLEADRMGGLLAALDQSNLDNQRAVVQNEKRQSRDNQPYGSWLDKMHELGWPVDHPYHHSTIGSMADLDAASLEDVRDFYSAWYAPDNAVLSVVGDVETEETLAEIEKFFSGIPAKGQFPDQPKTTLPTRFGGEIRETVIERVPVPRIFAAYRSGPYGSAEYDAMTMACIILGGGRGSRLHRELVLNKQLMHASDGDVIDGWPLIGGATLMIADLPAREGVEPEVLETAFHEVVETMATGITDDELERARAMVTSGFLHELSSVDARANGFSQHAILFGDPAGLEQELPRLLAVTADDVAAAAAAVLTSDNRLVITYLPEGDSADADEVAA